MELYTRDYYNISTHFNVKYSYTPKVKEPYAITGKQVDEKMGREISR